MGYVELASFEGVRLFAESRLLAVLGDAGPSLRLGGPPFARHLPVELDRPERWIDFLEGPGGAGREAAGRTAQTVGDEAQPITGRRRGRR